jgi:hypothetical protein
VATHTVEVRGFALQTVERRVKKLIGVILIESLPRLTTIPLTEARRACVVEAISTQIFVTPGTHIWAVPPLQKLPGVVHAVFC